MTGPFVEVKMEVEDLHLGLQGIRHHHEAFPRQRKRFDREDDERRYQEFVRSVCERRGEEREEIGRRCDELFERQCQKLDDEYQDLFDREYHKMQRQIEQRKQQVLPLSKDQLPLSLTEYLTACHGLHVQFKKGACRSLITQKETLSWTFPRQIIPWGLGFESLQKNIWHRLLPVCYFTKQRIFPSPQQLENVGRTLSAVNSEASLQHFGLHTIESAIMEMLARLAEDDVLWNGLGLSDGVWVTMETDKDLGQVYEPMLQSSWHNGTGELQLSMRNSHRRAKRQGIWANRSCIYRQLDGENGTPAPVFAFLHQLPHRLQLDEIDCGLVSEIQLVQDVIEKEGSDFEFASKTLVAATITQLYAYMVSKNIRYGCVSTGEALIFCCISRDDPSNIYCSACVPERDAQQDDPTWLHRTAAASVFAFVVHALREEPLPESWYDSVKNLDAWTMGYDDVLDKVRKMGAPKPQASPAQQEHHRWRGFDRSPLLAEHMRGRSDGKRGEDIRHWLDNVSSQDVADGGFNEKNGTKKPTTIQDQPFCSHKCLLGLAHGTPMDENCPNYDYHGFQHPDCDDFLNDLREQLAEGADSDANFIPLGTSSLHKSLFKVRQAARSYTFVAKQGKGLAHLWSEKLVYDEMEQYQGRHVPICLGLLELERPRQGYRQQFNELLLLSWAGRPFQNCLRQTSRDRVASKVEDILQALHNQDILYNGCLEPSHFLYDASRDEVMIVDFGESSTRFTHLPGEDRGGYLMPKKRKRGLPDSAMLVFEKDMVDAVSTILQSAAPSHERRFSELESEIGDDSLSNRW